MIRTAVVAGASGWIGRHLRAALEGAGTQVRTVGRGPSCDAGWGGGLADVVDGADLVVNLAGRSVSCRYTRRTADEILSSRTETTAALGRAIAAVADPPSLWINASTGTIYRDARDRAMDEATGELGSGFSVAVARAWEHELFRAPVPGAVRRVALRMAIVLGPGGGALNPLIDLARLGLGGPMGDGGQIVSWVHVEDVARAVTHLHGHPGIAGPVNLATPHPVTNAELMAAVREALGRPRGLPTPRALLELGARIIRTEPELVLKSRWVTPRVLLDSGFRFAHPTLPGALHRIARDTPRGLLPVALG